MERIKSIIGEVLKGIREKQGQCPDEQIEDIWVRCVRKNTAQHTKVRFFKKGKLYINIENPGWLFELNTKKEKIVEKLKKLSKNKIKDIRFKIGDIYGK